MVHEDDYQQHYRGQRSVPLFLGIHFGSYPSIDVAATLKDASEVDDKAAMVESPVMPKAQVVMVLRGL